MLDENMCKSQSWPTGFHHETGQYILLLNIPIFGYFFLKAWLIADDLWVSTKWMVTGIREIERCKKNKTQNQHGAPLGLIAFILAENTTWKAK